MVVGDFSFGQQHVHMPWHPPCHRMNRIADFHALLVQQLGKLLQGVLRTRNCQAIAGDNHHAAGVGHHKRRIFCRAGLVVFRPAIHCATRRDFCAKAP